MAEAHREEIAKLEALYAAHPEGRVFTHLAEAYRRAGELDRARDILEDGLRRHPDYSSAHVVFGRVLMDLGETTGATSAFRRVLDLDRHNLVALRSLGDLSEKTGDRATAIGYYRDLIALDPTDDWLRMTVARLEEELRAPAPQAVETGPAEMGAQEEAAHEMPGVEVTSGLEMPLAQDVAPLADLETFELAAPEEETARDDRGAFSLGWPGAADEEGEPPAIPFGGEETLGTELPELPMLAGDELDVVENGRAAEVPDAYAGLGWADEPREESILEGLELPTEPFPEEVQPDAEEPSVADDVTWMSVGERAEAAWSPSAELKDEIPVEDRVEEITTWGPPQETWTADQPAPHEALVEEESQTFRAGEPPAEVVTETMAELYARQGFYDRAIEVYRQLIDQVPDDVRLRERLREIEALDATATATHGDEQPPEVLAWAVPYEVEETETEAWVESVESAWTGGGGVAGAAETPYAWADSSAGDEGAAASGTTAGEYFRNLLGWRPMQATTPEAEDVLELTDEQAVAVGPDEGEIVLDTGAVEAAFEEWFGGEPPASGSAGEATREERGEASEADADLEMFRSWLQSLKK